MRFIVGLMVVLGLLFGAILLGAWTDSDSRLAAQARAREAEALARAAEAEADKRVADALALQAEADLELHAAAGYAIREQSDLVTYYAHRGWTAAVWLLSLALTLLSVVLIVREWRLVQVRALRMRRKPEAIEKREVWTPVVLTLRDWYAQREEERK